MALSPLNQRRWRNFKANRRALWSLVIFAVLFGLTLFAELLANDKPLLISYRGDLHAPFLRFYTEKDFGGDFLTEANYRSSEVQCLIVTGGLVDCFDDPEGITQAVADGSDLQARGEMMLAAFAGGVSRASSAVRSSRVRSRTANAF